MVGRHALRHGGHVLDAAPQKQDRKTAPLRQVHTHPLHYSMPSGAALVFAFPFDIWILDGSPDPVTVTIGGSSLSFYWPFNSNGSKGPVVSSIPFERVPFRPGTRNSVPPLAITANPAPPDGSILADSMRVDVLPLPTDLSSAAHTDAERVVASFLSRVRHLTGQWWVGHAHHEFQSWLRNWYQVDPTGMLTSRDVSLPTRLESRMGFEQPLSAQTFSEAAADAAAGLSTPLHWESFYDATFFFIAHEAVARAVVEASTSCELAIEGSIARLAALRSHPFDGMSRVLDRGDFIGNIRNALVTVLHRSYAEEHPVEFERLRSLWAARGSVAHGRLTSIGSRAGVPDLPTVSGMLNSVLHFLKWLESAV